MSHSMIFESETETDVLWRCSVCSAPLGFNKPGAGKPSATNTELPEGWEQYIQECPGAHAPAIDQATQDVNDLKTIHTLSTRTP